MEDLIKRQREIEEAPDKMIINGIEYRKVVPEKEELTLTDLIKRWERQFWFKWDKKENQSYELYIQEIERLVQMIEEWLPPASPASFGYREMLLRKFR